MTPEYFFQNVRTPIHWKINGWRHVRDPETQEIISYGRVFDDRVSKIIRISFTVYSESIGITERTVVNGKTKYTTVADSYSSDLKNFNQYIAENYK